MISKDRHGTLDWDIGTLNLSIVTIKIPTSDCNPT